MRALADIDTWSGGIYINRLGGGGTPLRSPRAENIQVHSVIQERPGLLFVDRTTLPSTNSYKGADAIAILTKMAIHLSPGRISIVVVVPISLKPQQNEKKGYSGSNESIVALYTLRLEGKGFEYRVFCLGRYASKAQINLAG